MFGQSCPKLVLDVALGGGRHGARISDGGLQPKHWVAMGEESWSLGYPFFLTDHPMNDGGSKPQNRA